MQMTLWTSVVLSGLLVSGLVPQEPRTDLDKLQGTWHVVSLESQGEKQPADKVAKLGLSLTIQGDKYTEKAGEKTLEEGTLKLESSKTPRAMDILIRTGPDKGKTQLAIYKLENDTFTAAIAPADSNERPTSFTTQAGSDVSVQVFRREKK